MSRKIVFIANPRSGLMQKGKQTAEEIRKKFNRIDGEVQIWETSYRGEGREMGLRALDLGFDTVVAIGGDGTINDIASALVNTPVQFGVIPSGSGNGFARNFGIPLDFESALQLIADGNNTIRIDCGEANGHRFFNVLGFGLDAQIAIDFEHFGIRGVLPYFWVSFAALMKYRFTEVEIQYQNSEEFVTPLSVVFANGKQFGNNAIIAPSAEFNDGLLDMVVYNGQSKPLALVDAFRLLKGNIDKSNQIRYVRLSQAKIRINDHIYAHVDGEPIHLGEEIDIKVIPNALTVLSTIKNEGKL